MPYPMITDMNMTQGLQVPLCYANNVTGGLFVRLLLFAVWIIFVVGGYFIQKRSVGTGDLPSSLAVGGFVTSVFAILLRLVQYNGTSCLVDGWTLSITIVIAGISVLYLLFSRD